MTRFNVNVNGQAHTLAQGATLASYVESAGYRRDRIATEVNGEIVPRASYDDRVLADGDRLEIVHFMGGG